MNDYSFAVNLRENILRVSYEKFSMAKMIGSMNYLIKQVKVAEIGVNRCGEEESLVLHAGMEELMAVPDLICSIA